MNIPIGQTYTVETRGSCLKRARCEACGREYFYRLERTESGACTSWFWLNNRGAAELAEKRARARLERYLRNDADAVACPACGWFQRETVKVLKKQKFEGAIFGGCLIYVLLAIVAGTLGRFWFDSVAPNAARFILLGVAASGVAGVPAVVFLLRIRHDPNRERPKKGETRAARAAASKGVLTEGLFAARAEAVNDGMRQSMISLPENQPVKRLDLAETAGTGESEGAPAEKSAEEPSPGALAALRAQVDLALRRFGEGETTDGIISEFKTTGMPETLARKIVVYAAGLAQEEREKREAALAPARPIGVPEAEWKKAAAFAGLAPSETFPAPERKGKLDGALVVWGLIFLVFGVVLLSAAFGEPPERIKGKIIGVLLARAIGWNSVMLLGSGVCLSLGIYTLYTSGLTDLLLGLGGAGEQNGRPEDARGGRKGSKAVSGAGHPVLSAQPPASDTGAGAPGIACIKCGRPAEPLFSIGRTGGAAAPEVLCSFHACLSCGQVTAEQKGVKEPLERFLESRYRPPMTEEVGAELAAAIGSLSEKGDGEGVREDLLRQAGLVGEEAERERARRKGTPGEGTS